jgi:hypothetical protein
VLRKSVKVNRDEKEVAAASAASAAAAAAASVINPGPALDKKDLVTLKEIKSHIGGAALATCFACMSLSLMDVMAVCVRWRWGGRSAQHSVVEIGCVFVARATVVCGRARRLWRHWNTRYVPPPATTRMCVCVWRPPVPAPVPVLA